MTWRSRAACRDADPGVFFPESHGSSYLWKTDVDKAKAWCSICPVSAECAAYAEEIGAREGVWGGLTFWERNAGESFPLCSVADCESPVLVFGYCNMHYQRIRRSGSVERSRPGPSGPDWERLKELEHLSTAQVADRMGVSPRTVLRWRQGLAGAGVRGSTSASVTASA